jgi:hypothetical protein
MMANERAQGQGLAGRLAVAWFATLPILALPHAAAAQSSKARIATAADCAREPSKDLEIACLRQALEQSSHALETHGAKPGGEDAATPTATPAPATTPAPAAPPVASAERPTELGVEQVEARNGRNKASKASPELLQVRVVGVTADRRGLLTLRLDNGQVWRETELPGIPLRLDENTTYPAEISRSGFGGYRMKFPGKNRKIVVKRIS